MLPEADILEDKSVLVEMLAEDRVLVALAAKLRADEAENEGVIAALDCARVVPIADAEFDVA